MSKKMDAFKQEQLNVLKESTSFLTECATQINELKKKQSELREILNESLNAIDKQIESIGNIVSSAMFDVDSVTMRLSKEPITEYQYEVQYHSLRTTIGRVFESASEYPEFVNVSTNEVLADTSDNKDTAINTNEVSYYTKLETVIKNPDDAAGFQEGNNISDESDRQANPEAETVSKEPVANTNNDSINTNTNSINADNDSTNTNPINTDNDSADTNPINVDNDSVSSSVNSVSNNTYDSVADENTFSVSAEDSLDFEAFNDIYDNADNVGVTAETDANNTVEADTSKSVINSNNDTDTTSSNNGDTTSSNNGDTTSSNNGDTVNVSKPSNNGRVIPASVRNFTRNAKNIKI